MGEIEKLYDTVGIRPRRKCEFYEDCPYGFGHSCDNCDIEFTEFNSSYPPFTAEKQLKILCFIVNNKYRTLFKNRLFTCGTLTLEMLKDYLLGGIDEGN